MGRRALVGISFVFIALVLLSLQLENPRKVWMEIPIRQRAPDAERRQEICVSILSETKHSGEKRSTASAIAGSKLGGSGWRSPKTALAVGLKVDMDASAQRTRRSLKAATSTSMHPATTLALLKLNSVVGVKGVFD